MKNVSWYVGLAVVLIALGALGYFFFQSEEAEMPVEEVAEEPLIQTIGMSVEGRALTAYTYGFGDTHLLFVGGMHGGYEWNSILLSYELLDYLEANPDVVPETVTVTVIPSINPDGVVKVLGVEGRFTKEMTPFDHTETIPGRFNANGVDLNRNFDCKWNPEGVWRGNSVGTGEKAFSEPESAALRDFVLTKRPDAVIFFHSKAGAVYGSECEDGILPETLSIMETYATAADYLAIPAFDAYPVRGDAEGWLASIGIPAITVELETHQTIEWERNRSGILALFEYYK